MRLLRHAFGIRPVYHTVDTCAAEFAARTPYLYSTYDEQTEVPPGGAPKVIILGSGPNRIGQGIEFDYACVHASFALTAAGYETVMVNCNPETVSTDYDTSGRLYFEPLTLEDVLEVVHAEQQSGPVAGVIVQLGGQTPLGLSRALAAEGVPVVGTSPEAIHLAEDRGEFGAVLEAAGLPAPRYGTALSYDEAKVVADEIGYPVLVRPSYVLGGRGMEIVYDDATLEDYVGRAAAASPGHPVLIDRFLDDAIEIDVDALYDGEELFLGGVMEHIEEAGIHSGDSACALPPITLGRADIARIRESTEAIARGVGVRGLLNVQYAMAAGVLHVLEANPRASRTVPFVSKATATPLAKAAARIMMGATVAGLRAEGLLPAAGDGGSLPLDAPIAVKEAVLPFGRFRDARGQGVDTVLGPEMRSTGEVMGIDEAFGTAYAKSQAAVYGPLPVKGRVFVSVANRDKRSMVFPVKRLADLGFEIWATEGTGEVLRRNGVRATIVRKHSDGPGSGRRARYRGQDPRRPGGSHRQHAVRQPGAVGSPAGRLRDPDRRGAARGALRDHGPGTRRRGAGHRGDSARRGGGAVVAGLRAAGPGGSPPVPPGAPAPREHPSGAPPVADAGAGSGPMTAAEGEQDAVQVQVRGTVLTVRKVDAYYAMTVVAPGIAARFRPGQFVAVAVGGPDTSMLLRRAFSIHDVRPDHGGTVEFVFAAKGPGTRWLAERRTRDVIDLTGPLGRPFPVPRDPVSCLLVGGGYGSAPLFPLADRLRSPGLPGGLPARRGQRGPGVRRAHRAPDRPDRGGHHRGRIDGRARARHRPAHPDHPRGPHRRDLRVRPDGHAAPGDGAGRPLRDPGADPGGRVDGLRHRGVHDLRPAGHRGRRRDPDGPVLRGGPGVPRRHGPLGRHRHHPVRRAGRARAGTRASTRGVAAPRPGRPGQPRPPGSRTGRIRTAAGANGAAGTSRAARGGGTPARRGGSSMAVDLRTRLGHVELPNPILTASGCAGAGRELAQFFDVAKIGAVVTKSVMVAPRAGRPTPRMAETPSGMLNSIGLQGPGIDAFLQRDLPWLLSRGARAVVSIAGGSVDEYAELAARLIRCGRSHCHRGEYFVSECRGPGPGLRLRSGCLRHGHRGRQGACPVRHPGLREAVTGRHRHRHDRPGVRRRGGGRALDDQHPARDGDRHRDHASRAGRGDRWPVRARRSGRWRCAASGRSARPCPMCPIIGMGGVRTGRDALELILAGASMVSVGTTIFHDPSACVRILRELDEELGKRGIERLSDVIGLAHEPRGTPARRLTGTVL